MTLKSLIGHWHFDPLLLLLVAMLACVYWYISRFRHPSGNWYFSASVLIFLIITSSPLHFLAMHYYFFAYMICHVLTLLVCGPLLVMAVPQQPPQFLLGRLNKISAVLTSHSWMLWFAGIGLMWLWHIPAIFNYSMDNMRYGFGILSGIHPFTLLIGGFLFSWPLFGPVKNHQLHPLAGVLYLFTACISCSLLGLLITFAPPGTYHHYLDIAKMGAGPWQITPLEDEQAAGLIMWVPCCFVYLSGCIYLLLRWFSEKSIDPGKRHDTINPLILHENGRQ